MITNAVAFIGDRYATVPDVQRRKFGLELGAFFDRHDTSYHLPNGVDGLVSVSSIGAYAGPKWVRQHHTGLKSGERSDARLAIYLHAMYAFLQSADVPPGAIDPKHVRTGIRLGFEAGQASSLGAYMRVEVAAMPSVENPEFGLFVMYGVSDGL